MYFRPTWRQVVGRGLFAGLIVAALAALFPLWEAARGTFEWTDVLPVAGGFVLGACLAAPLAYRSGASVDESGVHPIAIGRSTFGYAPWTRIVDIRPERRGTRTVPVIYLDTGEMLRMRAPYTGPVFAADPHFDEKVFMLRNLWETYRTWLPQPGATPGHDR
ncbi:hypothetical protein Afil01_49510 [Actinorhabdospora filicis]|uniref:PH domain-containing protein n=1 Tax=Actinorhabdospora filicis TaxID=1785913 RepID=A0A9W6SNH8_9ACTN|nr:hypothetical protein [Actinorhabdospora filicis]GLZ80144.1 hypothetical protein Afil01_49510 [Actinorhabdospora filicis]